MEIKVKGFCIKSFGDPSVGIFGGSWELKEDFYFFDQEELDEFKKELKDFFRNYYADDAVVYTFEELEKEIDRENNDSLLMYLDDCPVRYLIRDKDMSKSYLQAGKCGVYSSNIGDAIHSILPSHINENGDSETEIIKSTDPKFKNILNKEAEELEREIDNLMQHLETAERNLRNINIERSLWEIKK